MRTKLDRAVLIGSQYAIPKRYSWRLFNYYGSFTYSQIYLMYTGAVDEVLEKYNVELLSDIPYGKGFGEVEKIFFEKLNRLIDFYKKI